VLIQLKKVAANHLHAALNSFNFLCRRPLATLITAVIIAITLTLPTLFWVFKSNVSQLTMGWQRSGTVSLYLKPSLSLVQQHQLVTDLRHIQGVGEVSLKTPEEGIKELQEQEGMNDIMRYLPENPLPAMIEVVPAFAINTPVQMEQLFNRLQAMPQVEQAKLDRDWIRRLHAILGFVAEIANALMILLASAVVLIVGNTLRLAIHHRHEEIRVLKLIGASDPFIVRPFLYSGVWYGLIGAVFAVLFVNIFMLSLAVGLQELALVYDMHYPLKGLTVFQAYLIVLVAISLSWLGARLAVKRQLASIEPYN
jgi:cell division transport system permease protein